jgi:hypothetical protein
MRTALLMGMLVGLAVTAAAQDTGLNGWRATTWGMTVDQARAAVPELQPLPAELAPQHVWKEPRKNAPPDFTGKLWIPQMKVGIVPFEVVLGFDKNGGLGRVSCVDREEPTVMNELEFDSLKTELTLKYGAPSANEQPQESNYVTRKTVWALPKTIILLVVSGMESTPPNKLLPTGVKLVKGLPTGMLILNYSPRASALDDKL